MIYDKVKELATREGITIAALEREVGLSNGAISKWGTFMPNISSLLKVSRYFGVSLEELLGEESENDVKTNSD